MGAFLRASLAALLLGFAIVQIPSTDAAIFKQLWTSKVGANGGNGCMGCTMFIGLLKNIMQYRDFNGTEAIEYVCSILPPPLHDACDTIKGLVEAVLVDKLDSDDTADVICYSLFFCTHDPGHDYCHMFPEPPEGMEAAVAASISRTKEPFKLDISVCNISTIAPVCKLADLIDSDFTAKSDDDGDTFSTIGPLRGNDWRGNDCNDANGDFYPGHLPIDYDREEDSNCNGIYGVNPETGNPYEMEFCSEQNNYGLVMIGDSIGAHFHIPPDWLRANVVDAYLFENLTYIAANELDWPHLSFSTGHENSTWPVTINSDTNSIYWRLRNRNRCVHRDYQNLAFNGAASDDGMKNLVNMTRDNGVDSPAIVIYAMFGNDICTSNSGSVDEMTPVDEFVKSVNETLAYMDTRLPPNSHVITIGLVNGSYLYNILKGRIHPIGELNNDVTYDNLYDYFSCLEIVCPGWTNTNATVQAAATAHAMELSDALRDLSNSARFNRFDVHYLDCPLDRGVAEYDGPLYELIEPVDGLHPSKLGQDMFAQVIWEMITEQFAEILGPVNPHNTMIETLFGNQGGH